MEGERIDGMRHLLTKRDIFTDFGAKSRSVHRPDRQVVLSIETNVGRVSYSGIWPERYGWNMREQGVKDWPMGLLLWMISTQIKSSSRRLACPGCKPSRLGPARHPRAGFLAHFSRLAAGRFLPAAKAEKQPAARQGQPCR